MHVLVLEDCRSEEGYRIPKGSVLQDVEDLGEYWDGIWCSPYGTFLLCVQKDFCEEINNA